MATLNPALSDFWKTPARNKVLFGGRASSKSWDAAGFSIFLADNFKLRFLCARQFQNKIEESVYSLLKIQIERFGLKHRFKILDNKIINIYTGSEFMFYGLWRNIDEVKSLESIDVCWLEEAHNISKEQWEILEPTIRKDYSQIWIIFNPKFATDFVYQHFVVNPPKNTLVRKINYTENPFLSKTMLAVIDDLKEKDFEEYQHIYLGVPRDNDDRTIIKRSWIMAAIDAHIKLDFAPQGVKRVGFDIADSGDDKCATVWSHGSVVMGAEEWKGRDDEILLSCTRAYHTALEHDAMIVYDCIGVGASAGAKFNELNNSRIAQGVNTTIRHQKFNAGAKVVRPDGIYAHTGIKNKDMFYNLKAQSWWILADRFKNTYNAIHHGQSFKPDELISISSDCQFLERMIDELATPFKNYMNNGQVRVESKDELAKRGIASPNLADAFVMATSSIVAGYSLFD